MEPLDCTTSNDSDSLHSQPWGSLAPVKSQTPPVLLTKYEVLIGRGKESDVRLPNDIRTLSNKHCLISIALDGASAHSLCTYITDTR